MLRDYFASFLVHATLLAVAIAFSTGGKVKVPGPGEAVVVQLFERAPVAEKPLLLPQPPAAKAGGKVEPATVKLGKTPEKKKAEKPKEQPKKKVKTEPVRPPELPAEQPGESGSGLEISSIEGAGADGTGYSGPLADYYLAYDFDFVKAKISQNWNNPIKSNSVVACVVYFQIAKSGKVQGIALEQPSGVALFDRYAELAVQQVTQLPPLPQSFPDNEVLTVHLKFVHRP